MPNSSRPSAERIAQIRLDYALEGIIETDIHLQVETVNPAACSILGLSAREMLGRKLPEILCPDQDAQIRQHLALLYEQGINHSELAIRLPEGATRIIKISSIQGGENFLLHVFDDITTERQQSQDLVAARNAAEAASRAKDEFLANISHEIRTPLNGIIGLSQLLLTTELKTSQRENLENVLTSSKTLLRMLNDLLDFAKIESGKLEFESTPIDLYSVLEELASVVTHTSVSKNLELIFDIAPMTPREIIGDRLRLSQILINLLGNAVKFTSQGSIVLTVSTDDNGQILFNVTDTGEGIKQETLEKLFRPFSQADASTTRRFGGTGLGLMIARQLATGMGGQLEVTSTWGQGSTFHLCLPLRTPASPGTDCIVLPPGTISIDSHEKRTAEALTHLVLGMGGAVSDAAPGLTIKVILDAQQILAFDPAILRGPHIVLTHADSCSQMRARSLHRKDIEILPIPLTPLGFHRSIQHLGLLEQISPRSEQLEVPDEFRGATIAVAEDMAINQQVICGILDRAGIHVLLAGTGEELLALPELHRADLILMDVHMPVLDGYEATRRLRMQGFSHPVIGLSAGISEAEIARCMASGMSDFLAKPVDLDELWGVLTRWLPPRTGDITEDITVSGPSVQINTTGTPFPPASGQKTNCQDTYRSGLDKQDALERFLGNHAALDKALLAFGHQHGKDAGIIHEQWQAGDYDALRKTAHGLKGVSATIGARMVHQLACAAELLAPATPAELTESLIGALEQAIFQVTGFPDQHSRKD